MTNTPETLADLAALWTANGGVFLGIVGNQKHCSGYHLGRDRIYGNCACKPDGTCEPGQRDRDYSVQHPRDKAGLSNGASAIDLGKLGGTLTGLYRFSAWLVKRCQAEGPEMRDIREVIYWNPSKARVERYSGVDGEIHWGPGNGDLSHKSHTHISFFRDSEVRDKRPLFAPYFAPAMPDTSTEDPMGLAVRLGVTADADPYNDLGTAKVKGAGHYAFRVRDRKGIALADGTDLGVVQLGTTVGGTLDEQLGQKAAAGDRSSIVAFTHDGELHVALLVDVAFTPLPRPSVDTAALALAARQAEWDRISAGAEAKVSLPARP